MTLYQKIARVVVWFIGAGLIALSILWVIDDTIDMATASPVTFIFGAAILYSLREDA